MKFGLLNLYVEICMMNGISANFYVIIVDLIGQIMFKVYLPSYV